MGRGPAVPGPRGAGKLLWRIGVAAGPAVPRRGFRRVLLPRQRPGQRAARLLATALLLQSHDKVSDAEAKARADFDLRWKVALGIEVEDRPFAKRKNPNLVDWNTIRDKSWLLKTSGLGAFGLLVHDLREAAKVESPGQERVWVEEQVKKVSQLDWSNNSPIFKGTLVKGGRAQGSSTAISHAAVVLEVKLGVLKGIPRRTADSLLELFDKGELELSAKEKDSIRMARGDT